MNVLLIEKHSNNVSASVGVKRRLFPHFRKPRFLLFGHAFQGDFLPDPLTPGPELSANASQPLIALADLTSPHSPQWRVIPCHPSISGTALFTPDGTALVYPIRDKQIDNLWYQPLNDKPGKQITYFKTDTIQNFDYSPDGKLSGVYRTHVESDVVILRQR